MSKKNKNSCKHIISERDIISIRYFLVNYVEPKKQYDHGKLTHDKMNEFLSENGISRPDRISFKIITEDQRCSGEVLYVRDERGQIIAYKNPLRTKQRQIIQMVERQNKKKDKQKELKRIRQRYLFEAGYIQLDSGEIVSISEYMLEQLVVTEGINRQKVFKYRGRGRRYQ